MISLFEYANHIMENDHPEHKGRFLFIRNTDLCVPDGKMTSYA